MKKIITILFILIFVIILLALVFYFVDFTRTTDGKTPIFSVLKEEDSSNSTYIGLGYKILLQKNYRYLDVTNNISTKTVASYAPWFFELKPFSEKDVTIYDNDTTDKKPIKPDDTNDTKKPIETPTETPKEDTDKKDMLTTNGITFSQKTIYTTDVRKSTSDSTIIYRIKNIADLNGLFAILNTNDNFKNNFNSYTDTFFKNNLLIIVSSKLSESEKVKISELEITDNKLNIYINSSNSEEKEVDAFTLVEIDKDLIDSTYKIYSIGNN